MASTYVIGYDLDRPGQNYPDLFAAIKSFGTWAHYLYSTWIVQTDKTAVEVRDFLRRHIDKNDKLLVVASAHMAAWAGLDESATTWLKQNV